jgi:DNA-binding NtrC family response regulator
MPIPGSPVPVLLFRLESSLREELAPALSSIGIALEVSESAAGPGLVFCDSRPELVADALLRFPGRPVVVVSRLAEVDDWLNALEAGAADYCTPPFETAALRWIVQSSLGRGAAAAAA